MSEIPQVEIYSDGACSGNPGLGGWAAIVILDKRVHEYHGGARQTTNNRMELTAAIEGLKTLTHSSSVTLYSDSSYLVRGAKEWLPGWKKRQWQRKDGPLLNVDLWKELDQQMSRHKITWVWLRGHFGHPMNERADKLARSEIFRLAQRS